MRHVLSIAGSDSSGGAGIQADLKAMSACGVYGMTVITALTAQNTLGVQAIQTVDPEFIGDQMDSVFHDVRVDAVKIGMLPGPEAMKLVARKLREFRPRWIVVDPVMVAKSGHALMDPAAIAVFQQEILPLASVLTPNLPETQALTGFLPRDRDEMAVAGNRLRALGAQAVLIKGGHRETDADDVLVYDGGTQVYPSPRLDARHTHGTGCTLSSAIAALLARELGLVDAVGRAKAYVSNGIAHGLAVGHGIGPIHHFWQLYQGEEPRL
ncbi:MAG: bifunctional hydroxymethylpyrimidine kinase/phosphomethylpyrimidine kinase [Spirochaetales bacterium]|nr:bifunctional hydroxymethylpyrimidine kinase/phosphomethylpyrimidine kinase [Spirochaetales bacterium]